ncbi:MAG TPA: IS1182 family transposase [Herpetosiphonaceae bacterium]|nr:IS1182 family transposase [Herpetosiphonaceae bacterium]
MSLDPVLYYSMPDDTACVARAAFPKGNVYMRMHDEVGPLYHNPSFAALFSARGRPAEAPARLALITVMQFAENLSDRQAAEAVRGRIDWKYALSLELTDPGFDASVLCEFRARLLAGDAEQLLLDRLLTLCRERGLLTARGRQRTDSTHVLAAIHALNRLECVGETLRQALNSLAVAAPAWLRTQVGADWAERYGPRVENYRLPKAEAERQALATAMGADGFALLVALYAPGAPTWLREIPAVETLRQVWVQQYHAAEGAVRWRATTELPPAATLINSPHDAEARFSKKRDTIWTGYKAHLTETCDPDTPHLITNVATTPATTQDSDVTAAIHTALAAKELLPKEHLLDAGYIDADHLVTSKDEHGVTIIGPVARDGSWQACNGHGFDVAQFAVEWEAQRVRCPQGNLSREWKPTRDAFGNPVIHIEFDRHDCLACASRPHCTRAKAGAREMTLRPQAQYLALHAARERQHTPAFKEQYAARAGIEGTLSQGSRSCDLRRSRYIGLTKTHLQHILTATALNFARVGAWLADTPRAATRQSPFVKLMAQAA